MDFSQDFFLGVDPDLHATAYAIVDGKNNPVAGWVVRCKGKKDREAVTAMASAIYDTTPFLDLTIISAAVESQELYYGRGSKSTQNPRDIVFLAAVSGAVLGHLASWSGLGGTNLLHPSPQQWKGSVPKPVKQTRICNHLGWGYTAKAWKTQNGKPTEGYCVPAESSAKDLCIGKVNDGDWKHLLDAFGLALWCKEQYYIRQSKTEMLGNSQAF